MALQSSGTMSLSDIHQNINETGDTMPSADTDVSLYALSETMENAAVIGPTSRANIGSDPRAFSEFYGYGFPGNYVGVADVLYLGHPTAYPLDENDDALVEGEDLGVRFNNSYHTSGNQTKVYVVTEAGSATTGTPTYQLFTRHGSPQHEYRDAIDDVVLNVGSYEGATMKVKVVEHIQGYDSNIFSNEFTYRDSISGHGVTTITPYTSTTVDAQDEAVANINVVATVTTGTQKASTTSIVLSTIIGGDGGDMTATLGENWAISNTPGKIRFTTTHQGTGVATGRNADTSTADLDIQYAYAFDGLTINDTTINQGGDVFIEGTSEGGSGTIKYGYGPTGNNTYTDYINVACTDGVNGTKYERQGFGGGDPLGTFSFDAPGSYVVKAKTTSPSTRVEGTAFVVAPTISFSKTGNSTINISQTQNFAVTSPVGNNFACTIASNSAGSPSTTDHATGLTVAPLLANGVYTITFTPAADYDQGTPTTSTLTVRPTVSLVEDDSQTTGYGFKTSYTAGLKPYHSVDVTATTFNFTATAAGNTITSTGYGWLIDLAALNAGAGFSDTSQNTSTLSGHFSSNVTGAEVKTFSVSTSGNGATSLPDSLNVTVTAFDNQAASTFTTTEGSSGWLSAYVVRRGTSNSVRLNFNSTNLAKVNIYLCWTGYDEEDIIDGDDTVVIENSVTIPYPLTSTVNTSVAQSFSIDIPDVGVTKTGRYDIFIRDAYADGVGIAARDPILRTSNTYDITVIDLAPTTPGAWTTTAGGYSGNQLIEWGASSYAVTYKLQISINDSDWIDFGSSSGTSGTLVANSTGSQDRYYKVAGVNNNAYVDDTSPPAARQGGASTSNEVSSYNASRRFIIYPTITSAKNTINPATNTIYSTLNNSTGTTMTFGAPGSPTDNVQDDPDGHVYTDNTALWTISNGTTSTATITAAGTSTGTGVVTLTITGDGGNDGDQTSSTNTTIACYHRWDITDVVMTQVSFKVGLDDVDVDSFRIQGYSKSGGTAIQVDGALIDVETDTIVGTFNTQWTGIADSHLTQRTVTTNDSFGTIDFTDITANGNVKVRFTVSNESQSGPQYEYSGNIPVTVATAITAHRANIVGGTISGDTNAEDASLDTNVGLTSLYIYGLPANYGTGLSQADNTQLYYSVGDAFDAVDAGVANFFEIRSTHSGFTNGDVLEIHSAHGYIVSRYAAANVPPKTPGTPTYSHTTTGASFTGGMNFGNYTYGAAPALVELTGKTTTKTVRVNWADNSAINTSYSVTFNSATATGVSGTAEYKDYTGLTNASYTGATVTAVRGTSSVNSTQGATTTVTNNGTIYFAAMNMGTYAFTNIGTTSGTDFQMTGLELPAGTYTMYAKYGGWPASTSGNIDSDAFIVTAGTMTFEVQHITRTAISAGNASAPEAQWLYFGNPETGAPDEGELTSLDTVKLNLQSSGKTASGINIAIAASSGAIGTIAVKTTSSGTTTTGNYFSTFASSKTGSTHTTSAYRTFIAIGCTSGFIAAGGSDTFTLTATETGYTTKTIVITMGYDAAAGNGNGGGEVCFIAGTLITMSDYTTKKIEEIVVGDVVLSYNRLTSTIGTAIVEALQSPTHEYFVDIDFGSITNTNTYDHPYFVVGKGLCSYRPDLTEYRYGLDCSQLEVGDTCLVLDGTSVVEVDVLDIVVRDVESQTSYNLDTEELDMYFANGVLVHNKG